MKPIRCVAVVIFAVMASAAGAQNWTPQKNVELVVPNPPGGSNDKTARTVERILKANKLVSSTMTVVNRPGGGRIDHVFGAWREIFAPKGITPEQAAYWTGALRKATEAPEWKQDLERNYWVNVFVAGDTFAKELERDYASMKTVLSDIGLAK